MKGVEVRVDQQVGDDVISKGGHDAQTCARGTLVLVVCICSREDQVAEVKVEVNYKRV